MLERTRFKKLIYLSMAGFCGRRDLMFTVILILLLSVVIPAVKSAEVSEGLVQYRQSSGIVTLRYLTVFDRGFVRLSKYP
jgi:hypothetical protein